MPPTPPATEAPRDDDVLPESLLDAIENAARATAAAFAVDSTRCIAEVLVEGFWPGGPSHGLCVGSLLRKECCCVVVESEC